MLTKRLSNTLGCFAIASASDAPLSTSPRVARITSEKFLSSSCVPRISRHCTSGNPASIITENWRVKTARFLESTPLARFALVVLDLNLPDSDSGAALLTVESIASRTPVVVVSGATGILDGLRQRLGRCWYLLDKNDLDLGMLAAVTRLAASQGRARPAGHGQAG